MPSIIEEIQREALRPEARVGGLLRMVKLAAAKLKLTDVGDWVEHELNGYPLGSTVLDYRVVKGELKAFNPFDGWTPMTGSWVAELSQRYIA